MKFKKHPHHSQLQPPNVEFDCKTKKVKLIYTIIRIFTLVIFSLAVYCNKNIKILIVLLFFTVVIYVLLKIVENLGSQIRDFWLPKIMSGAFWDLMSEDGLFEANGYCVYSTTKFADLNAGGDFYRAEIREDSIVIIIGDVVSHGIAVSQGAVVALSAFQAINSGDPKLILEAVNRALLPIQKEHGGESFVFVIKIEKSGLCIYNGLIESFTLLSESSNDVSVISTFGSILGKLDSRIGENLTLKLDNGDHLILLTDGAANDDSADDKTSIIISKSNLTV